MSTEHNDGHKSSSSFLRPPWPPCPPFDANCPISMLVSGGIMFALDMLYYGFIMTEKHMMPGAYDDPNWLLMGIAYLLVGILFVLNMTLKDPENADSSDNIPSYKAQGFNYGFWVAALVFVPAAVFNAALIDGPGLGLNLIEAAAHMIFFGVTGVVAASMNSKAG